MCFSLVGVEKLVFQRNYITMPVTTICTRNLSFHSKTLLSVLYNIVIDICQTVSLVSVH